MTKAKFSRWNQPVPCRMCGKQTTWSEANGYAGLDLCEKCFDRATLENAHVDGYHKEGRDGFAADCRMCWEEKKQVCAMCGTREGEKHHDQDYRHMTVKLHQTHLRGHLEYLCMICFEGMKQLMEEGGKG
jgi:hypothetical protein